MQERIDNASIVAKSKPNRRKRTGGTNKDQYDSTPIGQIEFYTDPSLMGSELEKDKKMGEFDVMVENGKSFVINSKRNTTYYITGLTDTYNTTATLRKGMAQKIEKILFLDKVCEELRGVDRMRFRNLFSKQRYMRMNLMYHTMLQSDIIDIVIGDRPIAIEKNPYPVPGTDVIKNTINSIAVNLHHFTKRANDIYVHLLAIVYHMTRNPATRMEAIKVLEHLMVEDIKQQQLFTLLENTIQMYGDDPLEYAIVLEKEMTNAIKLHGNRADDFVQVKERREAIKIVLDYKPSAFFDEWTIVRLYRAMEVKLNDTAVMSLIRTEMDKVLTRNVPSINTEYKCEVKHNGISYVVTMSHVVCSPASTTPSLAVVIKQGTKNKMERVTVGVQYDHNDIINSIITLTSKYNFTEVEAYALYHDLIKVLLTTPANDDVIDLNTVRVIDPSKKLSMKLKTLKTGGTRDAGFMKEVYGILDCEKIMEIIDESEKKQKSEMLSQLNRGQMNKLKQTLMENNYMNLIDILTTLDGLMDELTTVVNKSIISELAKAIDTVTKDSKKVDVLDTVLSDLHTAVSKCTGKIKPAQWSLVIDTIKKATDAKAKMSTMIDEVSIFTLCNLFRQIDVKVPNDTFAPRTIMSGFHSYQNRMLENVGNFIYQSTTHQNPEPPVTYIITVYLGGGKTTMTIALAQLINYLNDKSSKFIAIKDRSNPVIGNERTAEKAETTSPKNKYVSPKNRTQPTAASNLVDMTIPNKTVMIYCSASKNELKKMIARIVPVIREENKLKPKDNVTPVYHAYARGYGDKSDKEVLHYRSYTGYGAGIINMPKSSLTTVYTKGAIIIAHIRTALRVLGEIDKYNPDHKVVLVMDEVQPGDFNSVNEHAIGALMAYKRKGAYCFIPMSASIVQTSQISYYMNQLKDKSFISGNDIVLPATLNQLNGERMDILNGTCDSAVLRTLETVDTFKRFISAGDIEILLDSDDQKGIEYITRLVDRQITNPSQIFLTYPYHHAVTNRPVKQLYEDDTRGGKLLYRMYLNYKKKTLLHCYLIYNRRTDEIFSHNDDVVGWFNINSVKQAFSSEYGFIMNYLNGTESGETGIYEEFGKIISELVKMRKEYAKQSLDPISGIKFLYGYSRLFDALAKINNMTSHNQQGVAAVAAARKISTKMAVIEYELEKMNLLEDMDRFTADLTNFLGEYANERAEETIKARSEQKDLAYYLKLSNTTDANRLSFFEYHLLRLVRTHESFEKNDYPTVTGMMRDRDAMYDLFSKFMDDYMLINADVKTMDSYFTDKLVSMELEINDFKYPALQELGEELRNEFTPFMSFEDYVEMMRRMDTSGLINNLELKSYAVRTLIRANHNGIRPTDKQINELMNELIAEINEAIENPDENACNQLLDEIETIKSTNSFNMIFCSDRYVYYYEIYYRPAMLIHDLIMQKKQTIVSFIKRHDDINKQSRNKTSREEAAYRYFLEITEEYTDDDMISYEREDGTQIILSSNLADADTDGSTVSLSDFFTLKPGSDKIIDKIRKDYGRMTDFIALINAGKITIGKKMNEFWTEFNAEMGYLSTMVNNIIKACGINHPVPFAITKHNIDDLVDLIYETDIAVQLEKIINMIGVEVFIDASDAVDKQTTKSNRVFANESCTHAIDMMLEAVLIAEDFEDVDATKLLQATGRCGRPGKATKSDVFMSAKLYDKLVTHQRSDDIARVVQRFKFYTQGQHEANLLAPVPATMSYSQSRVNLLIDQLVNITTTSAVW